MTMQAIGTHRFVLCGGQELVHGTAPIYGKRMQYLEAIKKNVLQVLVLFLGSYQWINVRPEDIDE